MTFSRITRSLSGLTFQQQGRSHEVVTRALRDAARILRRLDAHSKVAEDFMRTCCVPRFDEALWEA